MYFSYPHNCNVHNLSFVRVRFFPDERISNSHPTKSEKLLARDKTRVVGITYQTARGAEE